jgi:hypothetical protein
MFKSSEVEIGPFLLTYSYSEGTYKFTNIVCEHFKGSNGL